MRYTFLRIREVFNNNFTKQQHAVPFSNYLLIKGETVFIQRGSMVYHTGV